MLFLIVFKWNQIYKWINFNLFVQNWVFQQSEN